MALAGCRRPTESSPAPTATAAANRAPVLFVGHGAPTIALDAAKGAPLATWGNALRTRLGKPRALVVVSAHWEVAPPTLGTVEPRRLKYDFSGFPPALYEVRYPAPGAPDVAQRAEALLGSGTRRAPTRRLDHGVWTPLVHMFPDHDVPVLQVSLPTAAGARSVFELGQRLAPLRDEGVLLMGSGNITHNLRAIARDGASPEAWAAEYDAWTRERLDAGDADALIDAPNRAPAFARNHPSLDHWLPLLFAAGAASQGGAVSYPVQGFEYGNLSRRSVQLG